MFLSSLNQNDFNFKLHDPLCMMLLVPCTNPVVDTIHCTVELVRIFYQLTLIYPTNYDDVWIGVLIWSHHNYEVKIKVILLQRGMSKLHLETNRNTTMQVRFLRLMSKLQVGCSLLYLISRTPRIQQLSFLVLLFIWPYLRMEPSLVDTEMITWSVHEHNHPAWEKRKQNIII